MEIWKDVKGYEGYYKVSNNGIVKGIDRVIKIKKGQKTIKGKLIKSFLSRINGYSKLTLNKNGVTRNHLIHRLVAITFIPNPENKPQVNHKNGIKTDNRVENLEWCDNSHNQKHSIETGLRKRLKGSLNPKSILNEEDILKIIEMAENGLIISEISKKFKVHNKVISDILIGKTWVHVERNIFVLRTNGKNKITKTKNMLKS